jgi:hypothetical protein
MFWLCGVWIDSAAFRPAMVRSRIALRSNSASKSLGSSVIGLMHQRQSLCTRRLYRLIEIETPVAGIGIDRLGLRDRLRTAVLVLGWVDV